MNHVQHQKPSRLDPYRFPLILLTLIAFGLRLHQLGWRSLWYDELLEVDIAQGPLGEIGAQMSLHAAMPLDYILLNGWIILGRSEMWVRWPALVFGTLAVPLIYALTRRLFNQRVGLLVAALLTVAGFAVQYSQEVRPYALLMTLTLVSYLGVWQVYATGRSRYWALALVGLLGSLLSHYFAMFMLLPIGLFVAGQQLYHWRQSRMWLNTGAFALCGLVLLVILLVSGRFKPLYNVSFGLADAVQSPEQLTQAPTEKPNRGSGPPLERAFVIERVISPLATGQPEPMLFYNGLLLLALLSLLRRRSPRRAALLLLGWLILPIVAVYLFLLYRGTFYAVRYILYTLPAYLMLVAYGLDRLALSISHLLRPLRLNLSFFSLILAVILLSPLIAAEIGELQGHYAAPSREDWRAVGQLLHNHAQPDDAVIAVWAEPALNWYYPPARTPFHTYSRSESVWQTIQAHPRRWLILSSYSRRRDEGLREWLRENDAVTIGIDRRVVVYLQEEGVSQESLLAEVQAFDLPAKAMTYATLARQLARNGDIETSRQFYQRALDLGADPELRHLIKTTLEEMTVSIKPSDSGK